MDRTSSVSTPAQLVSNDIIKEIVAQYTLDELEGICLYAGGLVNQTWIVQTKTDVYVLQKLNKMFCEKTVDDYAVVQPLLIQHGIPVPRMLSTLSGAACVVRDGVWRMMEYISHDQRELMTPQRAYAAGQKLAEMHEAMASIAYVPQGGIAEFHNTKLVLSRMNDVYSSTPHQLEQVRNEYVLLTAVAPELYLQAPKKQLIHGDPKFGNLLFRDQKVVGIIDFDTMMLGDPLLDLGDALRSWSTKSDGVFNSDIFHHALRGYSSVREVTQRSAARATALITVELAARFLTDFVEQSYFAPPDPTESRAAFCLRRCREQILLYRTLKQEFDLRPSIMMREPIPAHW